MENKLQTIEIKLTIVRFNYWEHFKRLKEIALILPIGNSERDELERNVDDLLKEMHDLEKTLKEEQEKQQPQKQKS
jgi:hypothetical protein